MEASIKKENRKKKNWFYRLSKKSVFELEFLRLYIFSFLQSVLYW